MTKLNEEQVQQMLLAAKEGKAQSVIARDMGVSQATVSRYLTGAVIPTCASKQKRAFYFPDTNEKICAKCGEKKSIDVFYKHSATNDGWHSWCKACCKEGNARSIEKKYATFEGRVTTFLTTCKNSAKKRGQEFSLTRKILLDLWEKQEGRCFYSGIKMSTQPSRHDSVSVERIDPDIGYTKFNTVLVCNAINRMKTDLLLQEFLSFCDAVSSHSLAVAFSESVKHPLQ